MAATKNTIGNKAILMGGKASFVNVFAPKKDQQGVEKYEITLLFPKTSKALDPLIAEIEKLINRVYPDKSNRPKFRSPIKDGDKPNGAGNIYDGYPGHFAVRAWTKQKPGLIDQYKNDVIDPNTIYSGCYVNASFTPFIYNNSGNTGISFFLGNVMKCGEGEPLGTAGISAKDEFADIEAPEASDPKNYTGTSDLFEEDTAKADAMFA